MMKFIKYTAFPVLCGIVVGMMVASFTKDIAALSWLSFGLSFGMTSPLVLDLSLIKLTLGLSVDLNVATIICITLSLIIAKYINKR
jgi:hypothetical protein